MAIEFRREGGGIIKKQNRIRAATILAFLGSHILELAPSIEYSSRIEWGTTFMLLFLCLNEVFKERDD